MTEGLPSPRSSLRRSLTLEHSNTLSPRGATRDGRLVPPFGSRYAAPRRWSIVTVTPLHDAGA